MPVAKLSWKTRQPLNFVDVRQQSIDMAENFCYAWLATRSHSAALDCYLQLQADCGRLPQLSYAGNSPAGAQAGKGRGWEGSGHAERGLTPHTQFALFYTHYISAKICIYFHLYEIDNFIIRWFSRVKRFSDVCRPTSEFNEFHWLTLHAVCIEKTAGLHWVATLNMQLLDL